MKIVFVSDAIYPYNKGGKEKRLYEISTRLARLGHEVHIYTMRWWKTRETVRVEDGVYLHALCSYHALYHGNRRSIKEGIFFGAACLKLIAVRFDVLDVDHMPFFPIFSSWLVCKLRGKRLHGTWHEALTRRDWVAYMGKAGYIAAIIEALSVRLPYQITAASPHTSQLLAQHHHRSRNVAVVASGVDQAVINTVKPTGEPCDILYVGRFVKDKHVDALIRAVAIVAEQQPTIRCVIVGHGVEEQALHTLASELGVTEQIRFMQPMHDASSVYAYMKRAKVFVLPSVREGFGIVAVEALSCGTPVITTNSPANATKELIVDGQTGSIVDLDERELAKAMMTWVGTKKKLRLTQFVATYDWTALAQEQEAVYTAPLRP